ncbi:hypothetical protein N7468_006028 [Penicillium chermesinum]|uniref:NAD(P)-binding domain-containing protein n=1 Tax=Penicillium chermesinum TaxID=63820 RepID=A0A9W9P0F8_9EURO|nr:uncharacterized protein N7468_006028 [Penicillium chermesinum]KAJ5233072.1 hypothetical protein N7468_006028 [Penicillium chermesinum]KAJ6172710.1 hypothetical protein N7470_001777 [Penicillium chermesinum]
MHFLILGATGRTGVHGLKYSLEQGHSVTVLARNTSSIEPHPNLTIIEGSVLSEDDMDRAITSTGKPVDAVLVFLNSARVSLNPWAQFVGPPRLMADAVANAARALRTKQSDVSQKPRLVVMNAMGSGESYNVTPYLFRLMINFSNIGKTYEDHNAVDAEIEENCGDEISWTLVLAVGLRGEGVLPVKTFAQNESPASTLITRESCAKWMVDVAAGDMNEEFSNKRVIVCN